MRVADYVADALVQIVKGIDKGNQDMVEDIMVGYPSFVTLEFYVGRDFEISTPEYGQKVVLDVTLEGVDMEKA